MTAQSKIHAAINLGLNYALVDFKPASQQVAKQSYLDTQEKLDELCNGESLEIENDIFAAFHMAFNIKSHNLKTQGMSTKIIKNVEQQLEDLKTKYSN